MYDIYDSKLVNFINGRGEQIFSPAQLVEHLKTCGVDVQYGFVQNWLNHRLDKGDIVRLNQGIYRRKRTLLTRLDYLIQLLQGVALIKI